LIVYFLTDVPKQKKAALYIQVLPINHESPQMTAYVSENDCLKSTFRKIHDNYIIFSAECQSVPFCLNAKVLI